MELDMDYEKAAIDLKAAYDILTGRPYTLVTCLRLI
jgi:hypothetical protein